jgi:reactive intermediate/imine deaminase
MDREVIRPDTVYPLPWPYSHAVRADSTLYVAGQVALDRNLEIVGLGDARAQARQTWQNIKAVIEAAGGRLEDVVQITTFLANIDDVEAIHEVRREFFTGDYPTATVVEVSRLGLPGLLLETQVIAVLRDRD